MKVFRASPAVSCAGAIVAAGMLLASSAHAEGVSGSAVLTTVRDCGTKAATENCGGAGTTVIFQDLEGGPGQGVDFFGGDPSSTFAQSKVSLGSLGLPVVNQSDAAAADSNLRINVNAFAFNSFTYTGAAPTELSYGGNLHIVGSSGAPLGDYTFAGGSSYNVWIAIWDPSLVAGFASPGDAFSGFGYGSYDCDVSGVYAFGQSTGALSGGEQNLPVATTGCGGAPFMINPGQTILAVMFMQTPVNRGGWMDASHTFRMDYDPALGVEARNALIQTMTPGAPGVPEPETWALMLAGFGLAGAAIRNRRKALAA